MKALLWLLVGLGVCELAFTAFCGMMGKVPERTAAGMAWNAIFCAGLGVWALWLVVHL